MDLFERKTCWLTGKHDLEPLYCFDKFPVHMIEKDNQTLQNDFLLDMEFKISINSGSVQITKLIPEKILYQDSHFQTAHSMVWINHNEELSKEISNVHPKGVLEIGGGTGILERTYHEVIKTIDWTIVEPLPNPIEGCKAKFIKGFFPQDIDKLNSIKNADCIVHSNVWEHVYEPVLFIKSIVSLMMEGAYSVFSIPDFNGQLTKNFTSMMNFEHTFYLGEEYVDILLEHYNLEIINKKKYGDSHSIFYTVRKRTGRTNHARTEISIDMYELTKQRFTNFFSHHKQLTESWNREIYERKRLCNATNIYLFGAHISSQFYLAYGLDRTTITTILDNNIHKQGKRVGATPWIVSSPDVLKGLDSPIVILANSPYANEIKDNILKTINPSTIFLEDAR